MIDADRTPDEVFDDVQAAIQKVLADREDEQNETQSPPEG